MINKILSFMLNAPLHTLKKLLFLFSLVFIVNACSPYAYHQRVKHTQAESLASKVKQALASQDEISLFSINVIERAGKVTLSGAVDTDLQVQLAIQTASEVKGVVEVINQLFIRKPLGGEQF